MSLLFSTAFAAPAVAQTSAKQANMFSPLLILVVFAVAIYFLMWRPQSKRAKQHREMVAALKAGDEVVTTGGLYGKITRVEEAHLVLAIAANIEIMLQKGSIATSLPNGTIKTF